MTKALLFFTIVFLFSCSAVQFDRPMPFQGNKTESFQDFYGTYELIDSTVKRKEDTFLNALYYKGQHKGKEATRFISGIIYFEDQQMGYKIHLKEYYNIKGKNKKEVDDLIAFRKKKSKISYEDNFIVLDTDSSGVLIDLAKGDQLKSYEGNYYISKRQKENQWEVYQLSLQEELLYLGITNDQDKKELSNYTLESNNVLAVVHLEDDIFSKFVKSGGFKTRLKFRKHGPTH